MKTMKKRTIAGLLISMLLFSVIVLYAQDEKPPYGKCMQGKMASKACVHPRFQAGQGNFTDRISDLPDITDAQKKTIEDAHLKHMKKMMDLRNQLNEKQAKFRSLSTADKPDQNALNSAIDEMGAVQTQIMKEKSSFEQEVRKVLTDKQRLIFDMHHPEGKGFGRGHGAGCGQGPGNCPYMNK